MASVRRWQNGGIWRFGINKVATEYTRQPEVSSLSWCFSAVFPARGEQDVIRKMMSHCLFVPIMVSLRWCHFILPVLKTSSISWCSFTFFSCHLASQRWWHADGFDINKLVSLFHCISYFVIRKVMLFCIPIVSFGIIKLMTRLSVVFLYSHQ